MTPEIVEILTALDDRAVKLSAALRRLEERYGLAKGEKLTKLYVRLYDFDEEYATLTREIRELWVRLMRLEAPTNQPDTQPDPQPDTQEGV